MPARASDGGSWYVAIRHRRLIADNWHAGIGPDLATDWRIMIDFAVRLLWV
jgi:hypothetical protein